MRRVVVIGALGTTQTLARGSSYYLPAMLGDPIAVGPGQSRVMIFAAFSGSLLIAAFLGPPWAGRSIAVADVAFLPCQISCWRLALRCWPAHKKAW